MTQLTCFKAYDIRGELGEELKEDIAYRIGRAYGEFLKPGKIVVGGDVRLTSESLKLALARGLMDAGTDVLDIGHHGSSTSTSEAFLSAVAPSVATISCGLDNSYGHPHADTLNTLKNLGITCYHCDEDGTIVVTTDGSTMDIRTQNAA